MKGKKKKPPQKFELGNKINCMSVLGPEVEELERHW
jgi:hypothetical protein